MVARLKLKGIDKRAPQEWSLRLKDHEGKIKRTLKKELKEPAMAGRKRIESLIFGKIDTYSADLLFLHCN